MSLCVMFNPSSSGKGGEKEITALNTRANQCMALESNRRTVTGSVQCPGQCPLRVRQEDCCGDVPVWGRPAGSRDI